MMFMVIGMIWLMMRSKKEKKYKQPVGLVHNNPANYPLMNSIN